MENTLSNFELETTTPLFKNTADQQTKAELLLFLSCPECVCDGITEYPDAPFRSFIRFSKIVPHPVFHGGKIKVDVGVPFAEMNSTIFKAVLEKVRQSGQPSHLEKFKKIVMKANGHYYEMIIKGPYTKVDPADVYEKLSAEDKFAVNMFRCLAYLTGKEAEPFEIV